MAGCSPSTVSDALKQGRSIGPEMRIKLTMALDEELGLGLSSGGIVEWVINCKHSFPPSDPVPNYKAFSDQEAGNNYLDSLIEAINNNTIKLDKLKGNNSNEHIDKLVNRIIQKELDNEEQAKLIWVKASLTHDDIEFPSDLKHSQDVARQLMQYHEEHGGYDGLNFTNTNVTEKNLEDVAAGNNLLSLSNHTTLWINNPKSIPPPNIIMGLALLRYSIHRFDLFLSVSDKLPAVYYNSIYASRHTDATYEEASKMISLAEKACRVFVNEYEKLSCINEEVLKRAQYFLPIIYPSLKKLDTPAPSLYNDIFFGTTILLNVLLRNVNKYFIEGKTFLKIGLNAKEGDTISDVVLSLKGLSRFYSEDIQLANTSNNKSPEQEPQKEDEDVETHVPLYLIGKVPGFYLGRKEKEKTPLDYYSWLPSYKIDKSTFAVTIGNSLMAPVAEKNDIAIVAPSGSVKHGKVCFVALNKKQFVSRYFEYGNTIVLRPDNPTGDNEISIIKGSKEHKRIKICRIVSIYKYNP